MTHLSWVLATLDHWDKKIFWGLNQLSDHPLWFLTNTLFSSKILWISLFAFLVFLSFSKGALRERTLVLMIIGCAGFTDTFNNYALKKTLQRPRPCQVFSSSEPLNSEEEKSSPLATKTPQIHNPTGCHSLWGFPSNHAANFASIMTSTFLLGYRAWSLFFMVSALLVGLSRIFLGVHYPGDVVAGWMVGGVLSLLFISILRRHPKIKDLLNEGAS